MLRPLLSFCLLIQLASAAQLTVRVEPRWDGRPLMLDDVSLTNAAQNKLSITRLAMLLSHAQLQRADGSWIGAQDWVAFLDAAKNRLSFTLPAIPAEKFTALRFDLGLDDAMDKSDPAKRPANHPLHPDVNALHWSWRGGYVFLAIEGRHQAKSGALDGYSYHLAGQPCRGTIEVPVDMDLRSNLVLTLSFDAERVFGAQHRIDIAASTSTHSHNDGGLAERMADNAVQAFGLLRIEPDFTRAGKAEAPVKVPALLAKHIPAHLPQASWPDDNPITEAGVSLGARLFRDTRLSINGTQSCATCHDAAHAFTDARRFSLGAEGQVGTRNAMPLFNLAWKPAFFWDGRSPTLRDQVLRPIQDPTEMHETLGSVTAKLAADPKYPAEFERAFGSRAITADKLARALEQHLLTLISASSKLDRTLTGGAALTEEEQRGFLLFFTESDPRRGIRGADCFHCHGGVNFTNHQIMNNGLDDDSPRDDEGRARVTHNAKDRGKFIVPSLRNIALTAPYMHDGRFATLEEVIDHYDHGVKPSATLDPNLAKHVPHGGLGLSAGEKRSLIAFLHTLTDKDFVKP